jgi:uncharacterized membrane protein
MVNMRTWIRVVGALSGLAAPSVSHADAIATVEQPDHVTEATVTVDAPPARVYELVTDYARWPAILSDVTSVTVKSGGRRDATVRFRSRALEHEVTVVFDNEVDREIRFHGIDGPPGGRADGSYVLEPIDGGTRTRVTVHLYMDVVGVTGVFVRGSTLRSMRQAKLRADLTDVTRWFASHPTA